MSEETVFRLLDLPEGQDWAYYPDLNVIGLRRGLGGVGRMRALEDLYRHWRRQHLRIVTSA